MDDKTQDFAKDLEVISSYFKRRLNTDSFNECNLKDCVVIQALYECDLSMNILSSILNLSPSATTTYIDKLIENNFVFRKYDESDRRKVLISLSKKGLSFGKLLAEKHLELSIGMLKPLNKSEKEVFMKLLNKIAQNIEE